MRQILAFWIVVLLSVKWCAAETSDSLLADYFKVRTAQISNSSLTNIHTLADWQNHRSELRRQSAEMLGLDPMPERTDLNPVVTGKIERDDFTVEKLHFQSLPHLYVTANLYVPKNLTKPAPTVLYLCGHTAVITNGVSVGNKTAYQHHGIWFARNGYVCLIVDTVQWGEIRGHHWGTYREGQWWWNSRGYTPAGIETWNAIRALDYLESRPEVDADRIGVTGRSGGGAYSWFLAAMDDRVKVIAPVSGITDLQNQVVDGSVDQHCDCMFFVNTYRWDYPMLAALCAPRPLMLGNADADSLFPVSGVMRTREAVKRIYGLYGATTNFGLVMVPGPHKDVQDLQVPVFRWFNIHLKHEDPVIEMAAVKMFAPSELKVFEKIPDDQINTTIQESFVPKAKSPEVPKSAAAWNNLRDNWLKEIRAKCFGAWPADESAPKVQSLFSERNDGIIYEAYEIQAEPEVPLRLYVMHKNSEESQITLQVADAAFKPMELNEATGLSPRILETQSMFGPRDVVNQLIEKIKKDGCAQAVLFTRGTGPGAWSDDEARQRNLRRRFMLLGQTLDGMRVWDIIRAVRGLKTLREFHSTAANVQAGGEMGVNALYASLYEPGVASLDLCDMPSSQQTKGPDYLNVLKFVDIPQVAAMAAERCPVRLQPDDKKGWEFLRGVASSSAAKLRLEWVK
ncbi:alpha/beta hydrolase [Pedosphaera parvula]|uniref:Acetyl xylan esterase n=1 Tax=Pedosphaera parvula (strain Ellin514) TaxID=320771 RepID=B9XKU8_PEDPL|nr:alpha/beta hydrolase family protein [Pedosphaera parvula]EEF59591.1 conserved hypothetical protein [Pedosphaera parvula Ellin514]